MLAVPFVHGASLFVGGARVAQACPTETFLPDGVRSVTALASKITIGRDGFFVVAASGYDLTTEESDTVRVEVRDAAGALVPGAVELLLHEDRERPDTDVLWLGWTASDQLPTGARLTARVSASSALTVEDASVELTVADEIAPLVLPPFEFTAWRGLFVDTGPKLTCTPNQPGWCFPIEFGTNAESALEVFVQSMPLPELPVAAFWEYSVREVAGKGALVEPAQRSLRIKHDSGEESVSFRTRFRGELEEYCVEVTVRDLRTDESLSETHCAAPPELVDETNLDAVKGCQSVPHEYLPRWCHGRDPNLDASCRDPIVGSGGGAGMAGSGGAAGASGAAPGSGGDTPVDPPPGMAGSTPGSAGTHSSAGSGVMGPGDNGETEGSDSEQVVSRGCGCRLAPRAAEREAWWWLAGLAGLGLVLARRRAQGSNR